MKKKSSEVSYPCIKRFLDNYKEARTKPTYLLKSSSCTFIYAVSSPAAPEVIIQKSHREVSPLEDTIDCEYLDYFEPKKNQIRKKKL